MSEPDAPRWALRFERLLFELSARLVPVSLDAVDVEIARGLRRVVEFLGVDRVSLVESLPDGNVLRICWPAAEVERQSSIVEADRFPWTVNQLARGQVVGFSRLDELPQEASIDRRSHQDAGTRSCLSLPLAADGSTRGVLSFHSVRRERAWPAELVERLGGLSEVFAGALERKRAELSIAERLRFETLLSEQTATFSSLSAAEIDRGIERALRRIADFFEADWGNLAEFSRDNRMAQITHSWVAEGAAPAPSAVSLAEIPWVVTRLLGGAVVRFSQMTELPETDAAVDRQTYLRLGIKSQIAVPLRTGEGLLGALTFSSLNAERSWPDELVQRLQLLGEVFANLLSHRQAEMEVQQLRRELSHIGRVSTVGELTASLAHELTQPLTAILHNAQAAQRTLEAGTVNLEEIREILADIVEDDRRAGEVIHRLRGLLRKGHLEYGPLDVNEMVREMTRLVSAEATVRDVSVRLELAPQLPLVRGDRVQLQQVILNLVLNGLDAMPGQISGARALVLQTAMDSPATVRVAVRDSGPGINPDALDDIFEAFFTTKTDGLGMGLAIARSIVEAHGGRLWARNDHEAGATFSFTLPIEGPAR